MFERFTDEARAAVTGAQQEARDLGAGTIGTEHLLLALIARQTPSAAALERHGLTRDAVTAAIRAIGSGGDLDADALGTVGIDLDAVRSSVEAAFGPGALDAGGPRRGSGGHLPFSPRAKKVLELSLREAMALRSRSIADGHIALGVLREGQGLAAKVLADLGVDQVQLRREITAELGR